MPTPERQKKIDEVRTKLSDLASISAQDLARVSDLSPTINFRKVVPDFEEMLDLAKQLSQRDISRLPSQQLDLINRAFQTVNTLITKVREFNLNQDKPGDVCTNIINEIQNAYDGVMNPLLAPLAFTATQATDYAKIEREAKGYHATMKEESQKLHVFIEGVRKDASAALAAVKEQAAEAGVSTNAQIFVKDSETHGKSAGRWLIATIVMSAATILVAIGAVIAAIAYQAPTTAAAIQYVFAKLLLLSALSVTVIWCGRNYKSQKHNETLNKHRANALMTFRAFVEGTTDDRVKDAILLHASQAAFVARPTGYDSREKDGPAINPVIEVIGKTIPKVGDISS